MQENDLVRYFLYILLLALITIKGCNGKNVYISYINGQDLPGCGTQESTPCSSYQYADLNNIVTNNDVILFLNMESKLPAFQKSLEIKHLNLTFITLEPKRVKSGADSNGHKSPDHTSSQKGPTSRIESPRFPNLPPSRKVRSSLDSKDDQYSRNMEIVVDGEIEGNHAQPDSQSTTFHTNQPNSNSENRSINLSENSLFRLSKNISNTPLPELQNKTPEPTSQLINLTLIGFKFTNIILLDATRAVGAHLEISLHLIDCWIGNNVIFTKDDRIQNEQHN
eukprot:TCONS_00073411-protein